MENPWENPWEKWENPWDIEKIHGQSFDILELEEETCIRIDCICENQQSEVVIELRQVVTWERQ